MRLEEKAKELIHMFSHLVSLDNDDHYKGFKSKLDKQKYCALIVVNEILKDNPNIYDSDRLNHKYWEQVKTKIENYVL